jgi:diacylglycerol kinase family enzyme
MAAVSTDPLARLEALSELERDRSPSRRMLVIVNPYATTVSEGLKNLVVYALRGRYDVTAVDTQAPGHATELCRQAAQQGYDVVVAFGGDGTVNESANGLIGSDTPLCCLPGGRANVWCRLLGIPADVVDATEHLLAIAHDWQPCRVDVGQVNERYFLFSSGVGLDASVVERVDANPRLKARLGEYYYAWAAVNTLHRRYLVRPPRLEASATGASTTGASTTGVSAVVQNAEHYTYFGDRPVDMADGSGLRSGDLSAIVLDRATPLEIPTLGWRALVKRARVTDHRRVTGFAGFTEMEIRTTDERPLPLQVDGDYIGDVSQAHYSVLPQALLIVA